MSKNWVVQMWKNANKKIKTKRWEKLKKQEDRNKKKLTEREEESCGISVTTGRCIKDSGQKSLSVLLGQKQLETEQQVIL